MSGVFGETYAQAYDDLYRDKDYDAECELIDRVLRKYAPPGVRTLLDLGCGSGNHLVPLTRMGYHVLGVDRSPAMLRIARSKTNAALVCSDIQDFQVNSKFDAVLMMFAVLGYQLENESVLAALTTARKHLDPGGLFLFDFWYGPAVLIENPSDRVKAVQTAAGVLKRYASSTLDVRAQTCTVRFVLRWPEGTRSDVGEEHTVRFFFPKEIEFFLQSAGLRLLHLGAFPHIERPAEATDWNVMCVAEAV